MTIPQLTPFPDPPRIYQPEEEFDSNADEMAGHLPILVNEINAMVAGSNAAWADINTKTSTATNAATTASNAATTASNAATTASNAATTAAESANSASSSVNAAATSEASAAASAGAAAINAAYAKNHIDHVITQSGLILNTADTTQLLAAVIQSSKLLGGAGYGSLACIFLGAAIVNASSYTQRGDFSKIGRHASFAGAGYLHLKLSGGGASYAMPMIIIRGYEFGTNNYINEIASAYLHGSAVVQQQKNTAGANAPYFYYSSAQSAFVLRIKLGSAYYLTIRADAMDVQNANPFTNLTVVSGMLTPLTIETI